MPYHTIGAQDTSAPVTHPKDFDSLKSYVSQIESRLARLETRSLDLHGRQINNLAAASALKDATNLSQVLDLIANLNLSAPAATIPALAVANNTALQNIATATFTPITFDTNIVDTNRIHSLTVNPTRFTINQTGFYLIFAHCCWAAGAGGTMRALLYFLNGAGVNPVANDNKLVHAAISATNLCFFIRQFNAGDYLEWAAYQDSGGALALLANFSYAGVWRIY